MPIANADESVRQGLMLHQAGRFQEAEQVYKEILASNENYAPAWHLWGAMAHQLGQSELGAQMIEKAVQLGMRVPEVFNNLGECYRCLGRFQDGVNAFQSAIQLNPNHVESMCNLGFLLNQTGNSKDALPILERVVNIRPEFANGHFHYGVALQNTGNLDAAIKQWQVTLQLVPGNAPAMKHLGFGLYLLKRVDESLKLLESMVQTHPNYEEGLETYSRILVDEGRVEEAITMAKRAIEVSPNRAESYNALGIVYMQQERLAEAYDVVSTAVSLNPSYFDAIANLGCICARMQRREESAQWLERARELNPTDYIVSNVLHSVYYLEGKAEKSLETIDRFLQFQPQHADMHFNRAGMLLALGRFAEGLEEYEWRWRASGFEYLFARQFTQPQWDGSDPAGKTILVHAEQGYGDVIQFARYLPLVLERGAKVIVVVPEEVCSLVRSIPGVDQVANRIEFAGLHFDLHIPMLGFPRAFRTTLDTIPNKVPYFFPDPSLVEKWKPIIDAHATGLKVGLVWAGSPVPYPGRTTSIEQLSILADVPDVSWYSFQFDERRSQIKDAPQMNILDLGKDFKDFSDTAAAMSQMDMIITIDTGAAHLAGALGLKTWMMVPFAPDWRWLLKGETSPWYPTMKLFRQSHLDVWGPVVERIREELKSFVISRG